MTPLETRLSFSSIKSLAGWLGTPLAKDKIGAAIIPLLVGIGFAAAFSSSPLYISNQNQYFLHGMASAGSGFLAQDWLAQTADPAPLFSFFVRIVDSFFHESVYYAVTILLLGLYGFSITGIASHLFNPQGHWSRYIALAAVIIAIHAAAPKWVLLKVFGMDISGLLRDGVAGQYIAGPYLQPSLFGVLLIFSIYLFLRGRTIWAVVLAATAMTIHTTYLLMAIVVTMGYMLSVVRNKQGVLRALRLGITFTALALPVMAFAFFTFWTSTELLAESQRILVQFRLPHHAVPEQWLGTAAYAKVVLVLLALFLVRKSDLFPVLAISLAAAILLTAVQLIVDSNSLALLFPWRISVILVPIASAVIAAYIIKEVLDRSSLILTGKAALVSTAGLVAIATLAAGGGYATARHFSVAKVHTTIPLMAFVAGTKAPGDLYLVPPGMGQGFQAFRLGTGAPIFVDGKSIPYKPEDVIEWYDRLLIAGRFYEDGGIVNCEALRELSTMYGVSHAVFKGGPAPDNCPGVEESYRDKHYSILKIVDR